MRVLVVVFPVLMACSQSTTPDGGIDSGVAASTPDKIFGSLELWLDADDPATIQRDGGTLVSGWTDKAKHREFASFGGAGTMDAMLANGHGAMRVGAGYGVYTGNGPPFSGQALIAVIAEISNPTTDPGMLFAETQPSGFLFLGVNDSMTTRASGGIGMFGSGAMTSTDGWNDGAYHAFGFFVDFTTGKSWVRVDGKESAGPAFSTEISGGSTTTIGGLVACMGCMPPVDTLAHGHVAEVIVATKVTPTELSALSGYFTKKYALAF